MKNIGFSSQTIIRMSGLYLLIPFFVFCLGFLKWWISIPLVLFFLFIMKQNWCKTGSASFFKASRMEWGILFLIVLFWVFFSGIGGFAFQNFDFNGRNAIFRDLVTEHWPVFYTQLGTESYPDSTHALVYYFSYWLVPALFGKLFGWTVANIVLFLYTCIGVILSILLLSKLTKASLIQSALMLIFFSGMDVIGTLIKQNVLSSTYPSLWPPVTHLEWWDSFEFSSFTTQLFWVFNQAVPAWICTALILNLEDNRTIFLIWSLCFFFAPIPSLGLAVIILARILNPIFFTKSQSIKNKLIPIAQELFTIENVLGGGLITVLMLLFYQSNRSTSSISFFSMNLAAIFNLILFSLLEWLLLWLVVGRKRRGNLSWYFVGFLFLISTIINVADTYIMSQRATIAPLFLLMIWCGDILFHEKTRTSIALGILLVFGALTPLYEINRSIYRTAEYYLQPSKTQQTSEQCQLPQAERVAFPAQPEMDHPDTLVADEWCSLASLDLELLPSYVAETSETFFFTYLAR